ncbi:MAG TPA: hypothetical protein DF383_13300 [Deltaproteobacteria bacterium]|nr:hypothetical protein [Deltaproteobacteria bacterium]
MNQEFFENVAINKSPALQWYPDKALADTRRLSWKANGIYRALLDTIWLQFQDSCSIPDDDTYIAAELGSSLADWQEAKREILCEHRPLLEIKTNRLFSKGLWKEKVKQQDRRLMLIENGKKGGRPKKQMVIFEKPNDNQNKSLPSPSPFPSSFSSLNIFLSPSEIGSLEASGSQKFSADTEKTESNNSPASDGNQTEPTPLRVVKNIKSPAAAGVKHTASSSSSEVKLAERKTNLRLEIFLEEYKNSTGQDYLVGNFKEHGGAAKRTVSQIPDDSVYRQAVRAYLAARDKRIVEARFPYLWFIRELNRWVNVVQNGGTHEANLYSGFDRKDYSQGVW